MNLDLTSKQLKHFNYFSISQKIKPLERVNFWSNLKLKAHLIPRAKKNYDGNKKVNVRP